MSTKRGRRHSREQIVRKLRDADAMLNSGKELSAVLQSLEVSESTFERGDAVENASRTDNSARPNTGPCDAPRFTPQTRFTSQRRAGLNLSGYCQETAQSAAIQMCHLETGNDTT